jgi:valyl-tRNA synthetase
MPLSYAYNPKDYEDKIYAAWQAAKVGSPEQQVYKQQAKLGLLTNNLALDDQRPSYTILMPPPNLTGELHAGHAYEHYIMDTLIRIHRQKGQPSLWFPGVDHAGIQMEGVISKLLQAEGKDPNQMKKHHRQEFLDFAWKKAVEWRNNQRKQSAVLGDTPDYDRQLFTLDERAVKMVNYAFQKYWQDGLIYKSSYLINWSVGLQTALSDVQQDVEWVEQTDPLVTFEYKLEVEKIEAEPEVKNYVTEKLSSIAVSTVRAETIWGDVAVAIHPAILHKKLEGNWRDRVYNLIQTQQLNLWYALPELGKFGVKLVVSEKVDPDFGTGALKITPGHDSVDFDLYNHFVSQGWLSSGFSQAIGRDGKLTDITGPAFQGLTVAQGRLKAIHHLISSGLVPVKAEFVAQADWILAEAKAKLGLANFTPTNYTTQADYWLGLKDLQQLLGDTAKQLQIDWDYHHNVLYCERSKTPVEPLISEEFFLAYRRPTSREGKSLQQLGLEGIKEVQFYPASMQERAKTFIENIHDWCISRDLVWGHSIPVWYNLETNPHRQFYSFQEVQANPEIATKFRVQAGRPVEPGTWVQEEKILDTWFSSCLWPLTTLGFYESEVENDPKADFRTYFPTQVLTSATDIFYAWIVRMVILSKYFTGQIPFQKYFCHATILDEKGRKMSKSLKNGLDPVDQIRKYSSDNLRLAILGGTVPGRNMRLGGHLADKICERYRNFGNKIWNVARFLESRCQQLK